MTERTGTYNEVKVERERRMTAVEGKQARQRATLGAEIDSDYAETLAEADRTVNSAVETVNAELDAWRETVTAGVYSKTVTRSETDRTVIGETTKTGESRHPAELVRYTLHSDPFTDPLLYRRVHIPGGPPP